MKRSLLLIPFILAGCASDDYARYTMAHTAMQTAKSNADTARYNALASIAKNGDATAQVAAVIALMANNGGGSQPLPQIVAPKNNWDIAREWAAIIVPAAAQSFGMYSNMIMATTASNNARDTSISTNQAFVGMAGKIQAPAATVTNTTTTNTSAPITNTSTDSHNTSSVVTTTTDNHAVTTTTDNHAVTTTTDNHAVTTDNHAVTDDHTANPYTVVPTTQIPASKVCMPNAAGTLICY